MNDCLDAMPELAGIEKREIDAGTGELSSFSAREHIR